METKLNIGIIVRVIQDGTTHEGQIGIVENNDGTADYPNDYWIKFVSGARAPYGSYELEVVTIEQLDKEYQEARAALQMLAAKGVADAK